MAILNAEVNWNTCPGLRPHAVWIEAWAWSAGQHANDIEDADHDDEELLFALGDLPNPPGGSWTAFARCLPSQAKTINGANVLVWTDWAQATVGVNQSIVLWLPAWQGSAAV